MLKVLTLNEASKWDEIVKTFEDYDVYYLSGYSKGFHLHGDGQPLFFYYENNDIRAINVAMKRDISEDEHFIGRIEKNKYFDLTTPYGYGGWLIEGNGDIEQMIKEYANWCVENDIISEVIRFHPVINNQEKLREFYDVMDLGKTIAIDLESEEIVWNNFTTQNRGKVKKALKNNVSIKHKIDKETFKEFKKIYEETMNKDNATDYYYFDDGFYDSILNDLKDKADIFYAIHEDKMIAATIILKCNKYLTYHFSGVLTEYRNLQGTNLMLYEVAKWGVNNGFKYFHLGGGVGSKEDDLFIFKKSFNKKDTYQYSIGRMIFDMGKYNLLVSLRNNEKMRENFFPLYRA